MALSRASRALGLLGRGWTSSLMAREAAQGGSSLGLSGRAAAPAAAATAARSMSTFFDPASPFAPRSTPANTILRIVPQQTAYIVERFGKYSRTLTPGLHILIPVVDRIAYTHSLKETTIPVPNQTAITSDNVSITIDAVLYIKVTDPYRASYGVENALYAATQLAQTTMRSELGKISLDSVFSEREALNRNIVASIQSAAMNWGLEVLRYEIRDIMPPTAVRNAMELQAEAERRKRAQILESEGVRASTINVAEAERAQIILASEAARQDAINRAEGEASAIFARAEATARGIQLLADAIEKDGGNEAVSLRVAEQYLQSFGAIAKAGTTMLLPASTHDPASMVASALSIYKQVSGSAGSNGGVSGGGSSGSVESSGSSGGDAPPSPRGRTRPAEQAPRPATPAGHMPKFSLQHPVE